MYRYIISLVSQTFILVLIIGDVEEIVIDIDSLPFVNLMEFPGVMELDETKPDSTSGPIYIPDGLIFGDKIVTSAYVSFFDCLDLYMIMQMND